MSESIRNDCLRKSFLSSQCQISSKPFNFDERLELERDRFQAQGLMRACTMQRLSSPKFAFKLLCTYISSFTRIQETIKANQKMIFFVLHQDLFDRAIAGINVRGIRTIDLQNWLIFNICDSFIQTQALQALLLTTETTGFLCQSRLELELGEA